MSTRFSEYPLCRHIKTDGRICHSPALATSAYCHFHRKLHVTRTNSTSAGPGLSTRVLHPLRCARSVQQALSMLVNGISTGAIHPRKAGKMLFALQTASSNLRKSH